MGGKETKHVNQKNDPKPETTKPPKTANDPGAGLRGLRSTSMFRAVNPELFIRNNKYIMAFGITAISGCVGYLTYLNMTERKDKRYAVIHEEGSKQVITSRVKSSKWD